MAPEKLEPIKTHKGFLEELDLQTKQLIYEELEKLEEPEETPKPYPHQLKPFYQKTEIKPRDKHIIAWILTFCANMKFYRHENRFIPLITIRSPNFDALRLFRRKVKVGSTWHKGSEKPKTECSECGHKQPITKEWKLENYHQIVFITKNILHLIPCKREKQILAYILMFCESRIEQDVEGSTKEPPYTLKELRYVNKVKHIHERPRHHVKKLVPKKKRRKKSFWEEEEYYE